VTAPETLDVIVERHRAAGTMAWSWTPEQVHDYLAAVIDGNSDHDGPLVAMLERAMDVLAIDDLRRVATSLECAFDRLPPAGVGARG
jgi:hypothetical protein